MILFWLICVGLVAIALAFVLPTLLQRDKPGVSEAENTEANVDVYRDQLSELEADRANSLVSEEQYQSDKDEIERRLLEDVATPKVDNVNSAPAGRAPAYAIAFGIPIVAVVLYMMLGNSAALSENSATARPPQAGGPMTQQGIEANVAALAKRLEQNPNDAQGWSMLARSYLNLEKYTEASPAYARATSLNANDTDLLLEYAFVLAMTNNRQLAGKPRELVDQVLRTAPENPKALELAGSAEFQAKNYNEAVRLWKKVLEKSPPGSQLAQTVKEQIADAEKLAKENPK